MAVYRAPERVAPTSIESVASIDVSGLGRIDLRVVRPPVVLVHGIWSDGAIWFREGFAEYLEQRGFSVFAPSYKANNADSFLPCEVLGQMPVGIRKLRDVVQVALNARRSALIAASQVDVVGHSMGGLMARGWAMPQSACRTRPENAYFRADNYQQGDINRLVTVGTPHAGSALASLLAGFEQEEVGRGYLVADTLGLGTYGDAVPALAPGSDALRAIGATQVPSHAVATYFTATGAAPQPLLAFETALAILKGVDLTLATVHGGLSDIVVGLSSQRTGFSPSHSIDFSGVAHSNIAGMLTTQTNSAGVMDWVTQRLMKGDRFAPGIPAPRDFMPLRSMSPVTSNEFEPSDRVVADAGTFGFVSPADGASVTAGGAALVVEVDAGNADLARGVALLAGRLGVHLVPTTPPHRVTVPIPADVEPGEVQMLLVARTAAGALLTSTRTITVQAVPPVLSMVVSPASILLDGPSTVVDITVLARVGIPGHEVVRAVSKADGVGFAALKGTVVVTVDEDGRVTPNATGEDEITVTFGPLQARVPVRVTCADCAGETDADSDTLPDAWERLFGLRADEAAGVHGALGDADGDGINNLAELRAGTHPMGLHRRYLAEGATSTFFETRLAVVNPNPAAAVVAVNFLKTDGTTVTRFGQVLGRQRATVEVSAIPELANAEFSTVIESDVPVVVDRTLTWDRQRGYGSHAETAVVSPSPVWYLAEGSTNAGFLLFYLLQNPATHPVQVRVRYLRTVGQPLTKLYTLPPTSRTNIWVNLEEFPGLGLALASADVSAVIEATDGTPIIVERALYLSRPGQPLSAGHESAGVTAPATSWFLAEGATGAYLDLFVLIANPNAQDAQVRVTYLLTNGQTYTRTLTAGANSRTNIWVDVETIPGVPGFPLADVAVSTTVESTNGVPIIVERALWWPGDFGTWHEAHNSAGSTTTGTAWALAEGELGGENETETYILIANTSPFPGTANVTLVFEDGGTATRSYALPAKSRTNAAIGPDFGAIAHGRRFGAIVESVGAPGAQIVVERAMYSNADGVVWAAGTNALATRLR